MYHCFHIWETRVEVHYLRSIPTVGRCFHLSAFQLLSSTVRLVVRCSEAVLYRIPAHCGLKSISIGWEYLQSWCFISIALGHWTVVLAKAMPLCSKLHSMNSHLLRGGDQSHCFGSFINKLMKELVSILRTVVGCFCLFVFCFLFPLLHRKY